MLHVGYPSSLTAFFDIAELTTCTLYQTLIPSHPVGGTNTALGLLDDTCGSDPSVVTSECNTVQAASLFLEHRVSNSLCASIWPEANVAAQFAKKFSAIKIPAIIRYRGCICKVTGLWLKDKHAKYPHLQLSLTCLCTL